MCPQCVVCPSCKSDDEQLRFNAALLGCAAAYTPAMLGRLPAWLVVDRAHAASSAAKLRCGVMPPHLRRAPAPDTQPCARRRTRICVCAYACVLALQQPRQQPRQRGCGVATTRGLGEDGKRVDNALAAQRAARRRAEHREAVRAAAHRQVAARQQHQAARRVQADDTAMAVRLGGGSSWRLRHGRRRRRSCSGRQQRHLRQLRCDAGRRRPR